jgi:hypothetical protein
MMVQAGMFDSRPRSRELIYVLFAQRAARGLGDLRMHGNELTLEQAAELTSAHTPRGWLSLEGRLVRNVSQKERDYIDALATRYTNDPKHDRASLDAAYAETMGKLHRKYPRDDDAATLYAASLMNLSPWNYWTRDDRPRPRTPEILAVLEGVMERDPGHEGALHYYIHLVEAVDPDRGELAADRLNGLTPGAGHLLHMPSHIYRKPPRLSSAQGSRSPIEDWRPPVPVEATHSQGCTERP